MVLWGPEEWQEEKQPVRLGPSMHCGKSRKVSVDKDGASATRAGPASAWVSQGRS